MNHPKTMSEAVAIILEKLPNKNKDEISKSDKDTLISDAHFGMGMWIRNNLIHQNENKIDLFADFQKGCREGKWEGMAEPDNVSGVIVGLVWEKLHKLL